jgi:putative hemolysin
MKSASICTAAAFLLLALLADAQSNNGRVFRGEVSDSQCALNVHSLTRSHQEMLKTKSMGGTPNTCSLYCIEHLGGELVLVSGKDGKDVYHLDRADLVHGFEGQRVKITGFLDSKNTHLHVLKIELDGQP